MFSESRARNGSGGVKENADGLSVSKYEKVCELER